MGKMIPLVLVAAGIAGAMAVTTIYVLAQETSAVVAEVLICMFAAMICANLE